VTETATMANGLRDAYVAVLRPKDEARGPSAALDLFAFAATVAWATALRWEATDVIWGLWISSLTIGYATIVSTVAGGVRNVVCGYRLAAVGGGLLALGFFTFHFGMFHYTHAVSLNAFFPLVDSGDATPRLFSIIGAAMSSACTS
jgi:hypothetical protein